MSVDEEKLIAYADGELPDADRAEIERALESDAELRRRLDAHLRLRRRLSAAFDGALQEPVPERLTKMARGGAPVVDLADRRARTWSVREWGALAASLAAGVVLGVGVMSANTPMIAVTADGMAARGTLARALETQLAADETDAVRIGLTFRTEEGGYCRTFDIVRNATAGLACRDEDGWNVAVTAAHAGGGEVRMASTPPEVLAVVDAMIIGAPLDATAEAEARDARWRPAR